MDFDPRDHDSRDRECRDGPDPRDVFMRDLDLPRGTEREIVRDRDHEYSLRESETRTLSTVGAFRVVPANKLRDHSGAPGDRIIGALETCCRQGEMLRIQNRDIDWPQHQILIRAENAKDNENRRIPFDPKGRLAPILR